MRESAASRDLEPIIINSRKRKKKKTEYLRNTNAYRNNGNSDPVDRTNRPQQTMPFFLGAGVHRGWRSGTTDAAGSKTSSTVQARRRYGLWSPGDVLGTSPGLLCGYGSPVAMDIPNI